MRVIGGNGEALDLKGFTILPFALSSNLIWHEFGVVPNHPFEVLVGAGVLAPLSVRYCILKIIRNDFNSAFKNAHGVFNTVPTPRSDL